MTTKERLVKNLEDRGLSPDEAESVFAEAKGRLDVQVSIKWNQPHDSYPDSFYIALLLILDKVAVEWIEKNLPEAWFKSLFEGVEV